MPADERRGQILNAAEPLLLRYGREVSTRQIAEAAGVAEGTIFRVFDSKSALIGAAVTRALSAERTVARLHRIDPDSDLEAKLVQITVALQERLRQTFDLLRALGPPPRATDKGRREFTARMDEQNTLVTAAVGRLIATDRDRLVLSVDQTVQLLTTVTLAVSHPMMSHGALMHLSDDPRAVVDLVLHGALAGSAARYDHRGADPASADIATSPDVTT